MDEILHSVQNDRFKIEVQEIFVDGDEGVQRVFPLPGF